MKSTCIVIKLDKLGRRVISMELREAMNIKESDQLEIYTDSKYIILRKYTPVVFAVERHKTYRRLMALDYVKFV